MTFSINTANSNATATPLTWPHILKIRALIAQEPVSGPRAVRLSRATFDDLCERYGIELALANPREMVFHGLAGLRIVLDENAPFGKFKFEPDEPEAEPPSGSSLIRALQPDL